MTENLPQKQVQGRFQEAICNKRSYNKLEKANKLITTYHDEINKKNILRLRELLNTLPSFCNQYFRGIQEYTSSRTRVAYAYDIRIFFEYLHDSNPIFKKTPIREYRLEILDQITRIDIEEYLEHCSYYTKDGKEYMNDERGKARKLASLRSFYNYFSRNEMIEKNPAALVQMPKLHEKEIIRLDPDEVAILLDTVETGEKLTKKQLQYHEKNKLRDIALLTLMLGTGIRVSECVGIDISDVDFKNSGVKVRRKGGYEAVIYFGEEVKLALLDYLEQRSNITPIKGYENALFLSMQNKRITVRAVENLVKKYASVVTTLKKITPHKLRSTYGTTLYRETGDIYLVADVLGHKDVNTTRKHYAALEEDRRRQAAKAVILREKRK
jgi:integrase/recombinase XerC